MAITVDAKEQFEQQVEDEERLACEMLIAEQPTLFLCDLLKHYREDELAIGERDLSIPIRATLERRGISG